MSKINYHFIGIGGVGMSALAQILASRGKNVSGSDLVENQITKNLQKQGVRVYLGHSEKNISKDIERAVITAAITDKNPEVKGAKKLGIPIITRGELLGELMSEKVGIAITGTHGKTTTSSLISHIFEDARLDPTIVVGGEVRNIGSHAKDGKGKYFIAETCEYKRFFKDIHPDIAVITNIEEDHLDYYKDLEDIKSAFADFTGNVKDGGTLIACFDDENVREVADSFSGRVVSYGIANGGLNYRASDFMIEEGRQRFNVYKNGSDLGVFEIQIPGIHSILNATSCVAAALECGIKIGTIRDSIASFTGAGRRMEEKGEKGGITVIDDYAHHPTEIQATLRAIKSFYPKRKVWCVFQPHQHSRTRMLLNNFVDALTEADEVIIPTIYPVRDTKEDIASVSGEDLSKLLAKKNKASHYIPEFKDVARYLKENAKENDIIVTMGAGPVNEVGEMYLNIE
ncbi:UDP-N-acetylmuramate--L-alanine ligase [candidate division WS5 bacterium]|uniref:UDP-N-acetylmuramate--L-alanine ligase n=1 Tax=candidate division WS5 bacterium TaxID=2093353 RepID=A0A419DA19_9BACT|nr:MAG: UDP-N-acetylmuramate--L-alanine ligase [candidate division WS5 bacterium]